MTRSLYIHLHAKLVRIGRSSCVYPDKSCSRWSAVTEGDHPVDRPPPSPPPRLQVTDGDQLGCNHTPLPLPVTDGDQPDDHSALSPLPMKNGDQPGDHLTPSIPKTDGDQPSSPVPVTDGDQSDNYPTLSPLSVIDINQPGGHLLTLTTSSERCGATWRTPPYLHHYQ